MIVAWRSGSQQGISKMGTMALGGIFLMIPEPASVGSVLDLIFEVTTGARVRALERRCVPYHASLATSLATLNHFRREAVEHFQIAIELDQWDPLAYLQLGELYETMQLPWRAGPLYSKVLEMDPGHGVAPQSLAAIGDSANKKSRLPMVSLFGRKR
jgi:tetratricopeptide (TPR) repeat protein